MNVENLLGEGVHFKENVMKFSKSLKREQPFSCKPNRCLLLSQLQMFTKMYRLHPHHAAAILNLKRGWRDYARSS